MSEHMGQVQGSESAQASTLIAWEDRRDQLLDQARALDGAEAVPVYVAALLLIDRKLPGDFQVAEVWGEVLQRAPDQAALLWALTCRKLTTTAAAWQNIAEACAVNSGDPDVDMLQGLVLGLRAEQLDAAKPLLAAAPAGSLAAQYNELLPVAETKNWKKIEDAITQQLSGQGLSGDALKVETAHRTADIAHALAMSDRALSALQAIEKAKISDADTSFRIRLLYRDTAKWNNYVNSLKAAVEESNDTPERIELYLELIVVYREQMKLDAMVVKSFEAILDLDANFTPAYDALEETYDGMRRFPDLVKLLQRRLDNATAAQDRINLNLKIARVYIDKLARPQNAVEFFENILQIDPQNAESITELKDIYEKRRDFEKLIDIHRLEIQTMQTDAEKLARLREVADIATQKLKKAPVAIAVWREIFDLAPSDADAIDNLDQLYRREKDWENVADIVARRAELADDDKEQLKHWTEVGAIYTDRAKNNPKAIRAWRQVLDLEPTNHKALDSLKKLLIEERAWSDLEDLFSARDAWDDLAKTCEREANTAKDNADIIELLSRASRIHREHLDNVPKGVALLEQIFETDPNNQFASLTLTPYYEADAKFAPLANMLTIQLGHISDPDDRLPLTIKLASLYERDLKKPADAFSWFSRALREHPTQPSLYEHAQRAGNAAQQFPAVVALLEQTLDALPEDAPNALRLDLRLRIGSNLGDHLDRIDDALAIFDAVLEEDPDSPRALSAKVGLLERTGRFEQLIDVNERRLTLTNDPAERADILLVSARIHENNRKDIATATAVYEDVRSLLPRDPRPLFELRRLYRLANRHEDLADVIRQHLELIQQSLEDTGPATVTLRVPIDLDDDGNPILPADAISDPEIDDDSGELFVQVRRLDPNAPQDPKLLASLPLWFELGQTAQAHLNDPYEAVESFRRVLSIDPSHDGARAALEAILASSPDHADAVARILEPVYASRSDYANLVQMLRVQFDHSSDDDERFDLLTRTADLSKTYLDLPSQAFDDLTAALTIRPDADLLDTLLDYADTLDAWPTLAQRLDAIAADIADPSLRTRYLLRLSEVAEQHLDDNAKALDFARQALDLSRQDPATLASVLDTFTRLDAWEDAVNVLRAHVDLAQDAPDEQTAIKLQMAEIIENMIGSKPDAVAIYLDILDADPANDTALQTLDRLYEELEQWEALASNLERRADLQEDPSARDAILCKLARTLEAHLGDPARAVDIFRDILSRDPDLDDAIDTLRKMLSQLPDFAETIADILLPVYDMRDDWLSRIDVNEHRLSASDDPQTRIDLLHEIASLYEEHADEDPEGQEAGYLKAFNTYTRALPIDPNHDITLDRLTTYADTLDIWQTLADNFEAAISSIVEDQPDNAHPLLLRVASIYRDQLANPDASVSAYERASALNDQDLTSLDALQELYFSRAEALSNAEEPDQDLTRAAWDKLIQTLSRKVSLLDDLEPKKALLYQAATIAEEFIPDPARALSIDLYRDVLSLDDTDATALDQLERLYIETERWDDLIGIYQIKVDLASDPDVRAQTLHALGATQETHTQDIASAVDTYNQILSLDPNDVPALEALDRLYLLLEDFPSLRDILERQEALSEDFDLQLTLRFRRGDLQRTHLDNTPQAIELFHSILEADPTHADTISALEVIISSDDPDHASAAALVLQPAYLQLEQWSKLANAYEVLIAHELDPQTRIDLISTLASIQEDPSQLNTPHDAFLTWLRALSIDPEQQPIWDSLRRLAAANDLWELLAEKAGEALKTLEEIPQVAAVVTQLSDIYNQFLGRRDLAIAQWNHLLEQDPSHEPALDALIFLYQDAELWTDLVSTLNRKLDLTYDQEAQISLRLTLGSLCADILNDGDQAIEHFNAILDIEPGHPEAINALQSLFNQGIGQLQISDILSPHYTQTAQWPLLIDLYLKLLQHPDKDSDARYDLLAEVANIYLEHIAPNDPDPAAASIPAAITIYGLALQERPDDPLCLSQIERLASDFFLFPDAITAYTAALPAAADSTALHELLWRCATLYLDHIDTPDHFQLAEHFFLRFLGMPAPQAAPSDVDPDADGLDVEIDPPHATPSLLSAHHSPVLAFLTALDPHAASDTLDVERVLHALTALDALYFNAELWDVLAQVVQLQTALVSSDDDRVQLFLRLGQILSALDRTDDAIATYQATLTTNPAEHQALDALSDIYEAREDWASFFETLERKADVTDTPEERADIWARMAIVASEILNKPSDAISLWFQVIEARGDNLTALQNLEALYLQASDWEELLSVIERQVPLFDAADDRLEAFRKLGRTTSERLEDPYRALPYWKQAQETNPQDLETLNAIKALDEHLSEQGDLGATQDLAATLTAILSLDVLDPDAQLAHYIQLAQIYTDQLSLPENAIQVWEMILDLDPAHPLSIENLERLYNDSALWDKAAQLLERKASIAAQAEDPDTQTLLLLDASSVWIDQAQQPDEANRVLRSILELHPLHDDAFSRLEALLSSTDNWQELITTYMERVELYQDPPTRLDLRRRAAQAAEHNLGSPDIAFTLLLDALLESWRDKTLALDLEDLAEKTNQWSLLIESYNAILEDIKGTTEAIVLHNTFGRWYYLKVSPPEYNRAWEHFQSVLRVDPNNLDAYEGLAEIYTRLSANDPSQFAQLVAIQTRRAELLSPDDPDQRDLKISLYNEVGHLWLEPLRSSDPDLAQSISAFRSAVELDPSHLDSINNLSSIFESQARWAEQVDVLSLRDQALSALNEDPDAIISTRFLIAQRWENQLDDLDKAVTAYFHTLSSDDTHSPSLQRLELLLTRLERWDELLSVFNTQLSISPDTDNQVAIYQRIASVYEDNLSDPEKAISTIREIGYIAPQNTAALSSLSRLLRSSKQWDDLASVLQQHIDLTPPDDSRAQLYLQRGALYRDHLNDPYEAISNFQAILSFQPQNVPALSALADIYESLSEWRSCISFLDALTHALSDPEARAQTLHRAALLYWQHLEDDASAEQYLQEAIRALPSFIASLDALRDLYAHRGDFNSVIHILKQKVAQTRELSARASLFCQIGIIYDRDLHNSINAIDYFQQTIDLDPQNTEAAKPLASVYIREKNWPRAEILLRMLVTRLADSRDDDLFMLFYWLGLALEELGQDEEAIRRYRESYEYNTQHTPTLLRLGLLLYKRKDFTPAFTSFQTLLTDHVHNLSQDDIVNLYYDCGQLKRELNEIAEAQQYFHHAMEVNPAHEPSLSAMIQLCEEQEQWEHVVQYKRHRLSVSEDDTQNLAELVSIGDICLSELESPDRAVAAYHEALALRPGSLAILKKLLDLYTRSQQWSEAVEILKQVAKQERDPSNRSRLNYSIAAFYRDQLQDEASALDYYNLTLDDDVNQLKAFEAIDRILTGSRDFVNQERNYRKMIKRVYDHDEGQFEDTKFLLWYGLGEIHRTRLNKWEDAIASFQQALKLRPDDLKLYRILADLYVRQGRLDEAIKTFHSMLQLPLDPQAAAAASSSRSGELVAVQTRNIEFYHSLFNLYMSVQPQPQVDQAWCVSNLLKQLRSANATEEEIHNHYFGTGLPSTQGRFTNEIWSLISHPTENMRIGNIMAVIAAACRDLFSYDLQDQWGMRKKNKLALNSNLLFCKIYQYMAGMIGVLPAPDLYLNSEQPLGLVNGNVNPPSFILGADMAQGRGQRELSFIIARQLALATPNHYMASLGLQTEILKTYLMATIHICSQNPGKVADPGFNEIVKQLLKMPTPMKMELTKMMKPIIDGQIEPPNLSVWLRAVDYTANRIGLLLCGDLNTAIQAVRNDNRPISKLSTTEKEKDLYTFCISPEYFELRQRLGLSV
jgi:pentatricopeptide repeat protein